MGNKPSYSLDLATKNQFDAKNRSSLDGRTSPEWWAQSEPGLKRANSAPWRRISEKNAAKREFFPTVQGFDMIRHHLGQRDCEDSRLTDLETSILLLKTKLDELEVCRQECLVKLNDFKNEMSLQDDTTTTTGKRVKGSLKSMPLRVQVIESFMKRIQNLLDTEKEPFMVDVKSDQTEDEPSEKINGERLDCEAKRQEIKQSYDHLIRSVMPQLYGQQFIHRAEPAYQNHKRTLLKLRRRVKMINTHREQQLLDAKRVFLQEVDGYLSTLDEMVTCTDTDCPHCLQC